MEGLLEFAKGPLFRFSFAIMMLGLIRVVVLAIISGIEAKSKAKHKSIPQKFVNKMTIGFVFPIRAFRVKPIYSLISIIFHIGLLITPIFLFDHSLLFDNSVGISLLGISLSKETADFLTIMTIVFGVFLLIGRVSHKPSRFLSRKQDYLWPLLLLIPFVTGFICANSTINPATYNAFMLIHILSGCLIFILIPFTKIAHCVLLPLSQWISARAWKFPAEAGENITLTLGKQNEKI